MPKPITVNIRARIKEVMIPGQVLTAGEVARLTGLNRTSVSGMLNKLYKEGYLRRSESGSIERGWWRLPPTP